MEKKICQTIVILLFCGLLFGVCPIPEPCPVPFVHDPNAINFRVVGSYTMRLTQTIVHDFNSCDEDNDNTNGLFHELLSSIMGMTCTPEGRVTYSPTSIGLKYADFMVTDSPPVGPDTPPSGMPGTDKGTIVFRVLPDNRPPVLGGCNQ